MLEPNANTADQAALDATAGALLKRARELKGLTREAVADELNLLVSQVAALEENDFARFPGETFVRGHLRSYARLLKIDVNELLLAYGGSTKTAYRTSQASNSVKWRPVSLEHNNDNRWRRYSGIGATLLVLVALWAWQQHRDRSQRLSLTAESSGAHELAGGIDSALSSNAENALLDSVQLLPNSDVKPQSEPVAENNASAANNLAAKEEIDKLSLLFSADCWIEIKDRDNKLIVATLKHADEKLQIEGRGPFKVLLGYAPGVSMAYNGTPVKVDVSEGTRSTRLIVGSS
jgi:cytoskeleton protein RodZ